MQSIAFPFESVVVKAPEAHECTREFQYRPSKEPSLRALVTAIYRAGIANTTKGILDCGAWIGDNAVPWALQYTGAQVYAIDPSEKNCEYIRELGRINNCNNLVTLCMALSDKAETLRTPNGIDHCSFVYHEVEKKDVTGATFTEAVATTIDQLRAEGTIGSLGLLHLDVEGMEHRVVLGADRVITEDRPIVFYEVHLDLDAHIPLIESYFAEKGYTVYVLDQVLQFCRTDCRNCIAVPNELLGAFETVKEAAGCPLVKR